MSDNPLSGKVGLDVTDFKSGISELNRNIRVVESGFRAAAAGLGDWSKSASGLELRIKALSDEIGLQKGKVSALAAEHARISKEQGAGSRAAQEMEIKLNKETGALNKMEAELNQTETALKEVGQETKDASKQTDKLTKEEGEATGATDKFKNSLHDLKGKLGSVTSGLGNMAGKVAKVAAGLAAGLVAGAAGAVAGIGAMVIKSAAASDELVETAEKIGITTTRLQELNYIAGQTGTGVDTMQGAMSRMIRSLENAEKAGTPANAAFKELGISVRDSNGQMRDSEAIFFDAVAALGAVGNETERDQLAMDLFGKSALELNPLINLGAEGMAAMSDEAHKLGAVMGEETVTGLADLNDRIGGVKAGFMGMVGTLAGNLLPVANGLVTFIQEKAIPWLGDFLPKAIQKLSDFWSTVLQPAIQAVWDWLSTVLIPFFQNTIIPWLQDKIPKALQVLSDFWTGTLKPAIETVWNWMDTVLIPFLQNTVVPWLEVNIPKALETLSAFWEDILKPAIETVWALLRDHVIPFLENTVAPFLVDVLGYAVEELAKFWKENLQPAIKDLWAWLSDTFVPFLQDTLVPWISEHVGGAVDDLAKLWEETLQPALKTVRNYIVDEVMPKLRDFKEDIIDPLAESIGTVVGAVKDLWSWLGDLIEKLKSPIQIPEWLKALLPGGSPSPFEDSLRGINAAMRELSAYTLPDFQNKLGLSGFGAGGNVNNSWSYIIQAANPLQTSDDLARQVRLLELMHS